MNFYPCICYSSNSNNLIMYLYIVFFAIIFIGIKMPRFLADKDTLHLRRGNSELEPKAVYQNTVLSEEYRKRIEEMQKIDHEQYLARMERRKELDKSLTRLAAIIDTLSLIPQSEKGARCRMYDRLLACREDVMCFLSRYIEEEQCISIREYKRAENDFEIASIQYDDSVKKSYDTNNFYGEILPQWRALEVNYCENRMNMYMAISESSKKLTSNIIGTLYNTRILKSDCSKMLTKRQLSVITRELKDYEKRIRMTEKWLCDCKGVI